MPAEFLSDKPPEFVAWTTGVVRLVEAVKVVNAPVFAVVPPIAGGADKSKVPPKVRLPEVVTVPVKVKPLTVPVPLTEVTVPVVAFVQVGVPVPALVNTWPAVPAAVNDVAPAPDWKTICPAAPPAIFVAVVAVAAFPVVLWLNVGHVNVPVLKLPDVGVPNTGVTKVGLVANTNAPEPVSSVTAEAKFAELGVAKNVAIPVPNPVMLPRAGVIVVLVTEVT